MLLFIVIDETAGFRDISVVGFVYFCTQYKYKEHDLYYFVTASEKPRLRHFLARATFFMQRKILRL